MGNKSKIAWHEGMFMYPQHFQQQDRHFEYLVNSTVSLTNAYAYGFETLSLDSDLLRAGKLSILSAKGILPDGTPFNIPENDKSPPVITLADGTSHTLFHLCLPLYRLGAQEVAETDEKHPRYLIANRNVSDNSLDSGEEVEIQMGDLNLCIKPDHEDLSGYTSIGVVKVKEKVAGEPTQIDEQYIAPTLNCANFSPFINMIKEVQGLLYQRAEALASRLGGTGKGGSAEVGDYMLLQAINRLEPLFYHLGAMNKLHPIELYKDLVQLAGELSTFTHNSKRSPNFPPYNHETLTDTFKVVFSHIRQCLSKVLEQTAVSLRLEEARNGFFASMIPDKTLFESASFYLAIKADLDIDQIRAQFPVITKIAPVEVLTQFVSAQMPGIALRPLPAAPRQIPYHAGTFYFELVKDQKLWPTFKTSGGLGIHIGTSIPGLRMELWAVRNA